jgi:aminomethyltransferase
MEATLTKRTPLYNKHVEAGAKIVPFAGYDMPVSYTGINAEHEAVRTAVGMFDVSHMGEFIVKGPGALDLIQRVTSNDASKLFDGKVQYSCLPNTTGGIIDDLLVYRMSEEEYMLVVNASNIDKDWDWIVSQNTGGVELKNISDKTALLAVQGPKATAALQKLTDVDLASLEYYSFVRGSMAGFDNVIISATGYTGAGGFELYIKNENAEALWDAVMEAGKEFGIAYAGLGCRDTLRLEMGFCLYGNDIDDTTSPIEAGLGWITKFTKEFTASDIIQGHKTNGTGRKLVGFVLEERAIPRHDYEVCDAEGRVIGKVTSGTQSPSLKIPIGIAYVETAFSKVDSEIYIKVRDKLSKAKVVKLPFYKG